MGCGKVNGFCTAGTQSDSKQYSVSSRTVLSSKTGCQGLVKPFPEKKHIHRGLKRLHKMNECVIHGYDWEIHSGAQVKGNTTVLPISRYTVPEIILLSSKAASDTDSFHSNFK